jgi:hypothetical protein
MRQYTSCPWCDATDKADRRSRFGCVSCQHEFHSEPKLAFVTTDNSATLQNALAEIERLSIALTQANKAITVVAKDGQAAFERKDKALRVALDALTTQDTFYQDQRGDKTGKAITTIKEALA